MLLLLCTCFIHLLNRRSTMCLQVNDDLSVITAVNIFYNLEDRTSCDTLLPSIGDISLLPWAQAECEEQVYHSSTEKERGSQASTWL